MVGDGPGFRSTTQLIFMNLQMMLPALYTSCSEMVNKWKNLIPEESCELDVWPHLQNLTVDVISRAAFGCSNEEGQRIFQLQTEQAELLVQSVQLMSIPGFRPAEAIEYTLQPIPKSTSSGDVRLR